MMIFQLSGEHEELPVEEIRALYSAKGLVPSFERHANLLLADEDIDPGFMLKRLALTHLFYCTEKISPLEKFRTVLIDSDYKNVESYAIRAVNFDDNPALERELGSLFKENLGLRADLESPELEIYVIRLGDKVAISTQRYEIDKKCLADRDPRKRPFFTPLALKPKLAKLMINLTALDNGKVLDPFCGSASILIEASLMDLKATGVEKDKKNFKGAEQNLKAMGLKAEIILGDAREPLGTFDAIVTDPPYARSSKVFGEELKDLYSDFLQAAHSELRSGSRLVFAVPEEQKIDVSSFGFKLLGTYKIYVHKSLTRELYVCERD